jgi:hypothetical protein
LFALLAVPGDAVVVSRIAAARQFLENRRGTIYQPAYSAEMARNRLDRLRSA